LAQSNSLAVCGAVLRTPVRKSGFGRISRIAAPQSRWGIYDSGTGTRVRSDNGKNN